MLARIASTFVLGIVLVGCTSTTAAPTTNPPASNAPAAATPAPAGATSTSAGATLGTATATPAAGNTGGSGGTASVDGIWTGTWTKPAGGGAITLQLQQSGTNVSGTVTMIGSACIPPGTAVTGTITGPNIVFTASGSGFQAMYGGEVNGSSITGTLTASCSAGSATGTWQVTRG